MNKLQRLPLGGPVDLDGKAHGIDDGSLRKQQNIIPDKDGYPGRRGGLLYFADLYAVNSTKNLHVPDRDGLLTTTQNENAPIWCDGPKDWPSTVAALTTDGARADLYVALINDAGVSTNVRKTLPNSTLPVMFSDGTSTYFVFGQNDRGSVGLKLVKSAAAPCGFTLEDFTWVDPQERKTVPRYAISWRNRTLYAHFEGDYRGTVVISDTDEPLVVGENVLTDGGLEVTGGRDITGVHEVLAAGNGSPISAIIIVTTLERSYYLSGDLPETDDAFDPSHPFGTLAVNKLSSNAGCLSHHTICDTPYGTIWCGPTDVWFLPLGEMVPVPIGRRLKPILKAQPEESYYRIHAVYADGFYRLALFSDGQGPDDVTALGEQWWLDLRNGPPTSWKDAMWHGPMVFHVASSIDGGRGEDTTVVGTFNLAVDNRPGGNGKCYGVHHGITRGSTNSMTLVQYDSVEPRDVGGLFRTTLIPWIQGQAYGLGAEVVVPNDIDNFVGGQGSFGIWRVTNVTGGGTSGATEPLWSNAASPIVDHELTWTQFAQCISPSQMKGSEILCAIESKDYNFNDLMSDKLFQGVELSYFLTQPELIRISQVVDGGRLVDQMDCYADPGAGVVVGSAVLGDDRLAEDFVAVSVMSADGTNTVGKRCQIKLEEQLGILLPDGYLTVGVVAGAQEYTVELKASFFFDVSSLIGAIRDALRDSDIIGGRGLDLTLDHKNTRITLTSVETLNWAPSIATQEIRYIWSLLGMAMWNGQSGAEAVTITGDEVPFDAAVGDLAFEETNMKFQQFKRRPNT